MLAEAAEADATDDALYGAEKTGRELPAELQRRQTWLEKLRQAQKAQHGERTPPPKRGLLPRGATRLERMKRKLQTRAGAKVYAQRKGIVEPVFGQIKQGRGMRGFLFRGLEKVRGKWALICLTHNILKMHTLCQG